MKITALDRLAQKAWLGTAVPMAEQTRGSGCTQRSLFPGHQRSHYLASGLHPGSSPTSLRTSAPCEEAVSGSSAANVE